MIIHCCSCNILNITHLIHCSYKVFMRLHVYYIEMKLLKRAVVSTRTCTQRALACFISSRVGPLLAAILSRLPPAPLSSTQHLHLESAEQQAGRERRYSSRQHV